MKKSIFMSLLAAVSLGMATVSCSSDNTEDGQGGSGKMETYTISCSFDNDTRMALDASTPSRQYKWQTGDVIYVFNASGTKIATATLSDGAGTATAGFTFGSSETAKYVIFVSGGTNGSVGSDGTQVTIDPTQTYAYGGVMSGLPIIAQGELTELSHHTYKGTLTHKMSFIKFGTITYNGSATALTISGTSTATIDPKTGNISAVSASAYTNSTIAATNVTNGNMIAVFPGFNFSAAAQGEAVTTNPTIAPNRIYTLDREITGYTITYKAGDGGTGTDITETVTPGYTIKADNTGFTNKWTLTEHYRFANSWNTKQDGTGTAYTPGASYTATQNLTLYAQWNWTNPYAQWDAYEYWGTGSNTYGTGNYGGRNDCVAGVSLYASRKGGMGPELHMVYRMIRYGTTYWDNSSVTTGRQDYTVQNGSTIYHTGAWITKYKNVLGHTGEPITPYSNTPISMSGLSSSEVANIRTSGNYFFVPAASRYNTSGTFETSGVGNQCYIWTNRHDKLTTGADKAEMIHVNASKIEVYSEYIKVGALIFNSNNWNN